MLRCPRVSLALHRARIFCLFISKSRNCGWDFVRSLRTREKWEFTIAWRESVNCCVAPTWAGRSRYVPPLNERKSVSRHELAADRISVRNAAARKRRVGRRCVARRPVLPLFVSRRTKFSANSRSRPRERIALFSRRRDFGGKATGRQQSRAR